MQRGPSLRPRGKGENLLRLPVLVYGETAGAEVGDELVSFRRNRDTDTDEYPRRSTAVQRLVLCVALCRDAPTAVSVTATTIASTLDNVRI